MKYSARFVLLSSAVALANVGLARVARADDAQAEALYQEGRRAAQAKDWPTACKKFKESNDREPAPGTLLNLADCEENRGKLVDAARDFNAAARLFPAGNERAGYAKNRASALEKRLPKLTIKSNATGGATIECDGAVVELARLGTAMPMDPGDHVVVVRAAGRADVRSTVKLAEGESREIQIDTGGALAVSNETAASGTRGAGVGASDGSKSSAPLRTIGAVSLGVGGIGLAFGVVGGLLTIGAKNTVDANCTATGCNAEGLQAASQGKTWSAVSTVGFITAGVGVAAGVSLLVLSSSRGSSTAITARPIAGGTELGLAAHF